MRIIAISVSRIPRRLSLITPTATMRQPDSGATSVPDTASCAECLSGIAGASFQIVAHEGVDHPAPDTAEYFCQFCLTFCDLCHEQTLGRMYVTSDGGLECAACFAARDFTTDDFSSDELDDP